MLLWTRCVAFTSSCDSYLFMGNIFTCHVSGRGDFFGGICLCLCVCVCVCVCTTGPTFCFQCTKDVEQFILIQHIQKCPRSFIYLHSSPKEMQLSIHFDAECIAKTLSACILHSLDILMLKIVTNFSFRDHKSRFHQR